MTRVLIVDDKENNLYYLHVLLSGSGYEVDSARHGAEALVKARSHPPDLIVSDLLMPVMDGYTLLRHWKADAHLKRIPFIVYTATYTEEEDERLALSLGADAFILKPAEPEDFLARIRKAKAQAEAAVPVEPREPVGEESERLKVYSETLIRKLEEKTMQLEAANRALERDIAERRAMVTALQESEARLATATAAGRIGIWEWDIASGRMVWSRMHEELWGLRPGEFGGTYEDFLRGIHPDDFPALDEAIQHALATRTEYQREHRVLWPDGSTRWIVARGSATYDAAGRAVRMSGVVVDVTERKQLEQQFLRAQRMESIGTLAGGIAHDLNNVLGPIIMSLDLLAMRLPDPSSQELLELLSSSAMRGADMVRQVLSFARGVDGRLMEIAVPQLIKEIEKIVNDTFLKNIRVQARVPADVWPVLGDPTQLHQVLLNLCVNARDAMPKGGTLELSAANVTLEENDASRSAGVAPGRFVRIAVQDSGTGMPPEIVEKIFDPFFTTKEVGKGTGLGLSTSAAIVKSHGGFVRVKSEVGAGTRLEVYLPVNAGRIEQAATCPPAEMPRGNGELILVIDDEGTIRQITRQALETFGYRVVAASDGEEAVSIYTQRSAEIAVVLTDMMMPVMDGPATIQVLRTISPTLPIIAVSGLSTGGPAGHAVSLGIDHFLPKPYSAETLLRTLQQVLAGRG